MTRTPLLIGVVVFSLWTAPAVAQDEDLEPREVGGAGVTHVGFSGFLDKLMSPEDSFPLHATVQVDVLRFLSPRIALRGGLIGSTATERDAAAGAGDAALHALAGGLFYFTPRSMASLYAGGEYRARLTDRPARDAGAVFGKIGLQGAMTARVQLFAEGGYGLRLTRGRDDERQTRIVGEVGVRIRF